MRSKPTTTELIRFVQDEPLPCLDDKKVVYTEIIEMLEKGKRFSGLSTKKTFWLLEWFKRTRLDNNPQRIDEEIYVRALFRQVELAQSEISVSLSYVGKLEGRKKLSEAIKQVQEGPTS